MFFQKHCWNRILLRCLLFNDVARLRYVLKNWKCFFVSSSYKIKKLTPSKTLRKNAVIWNNWSVLNCCCSGLAECINLETIFTFAHGDKSFEHFDKCIIRVTSGSCNKRAQECQIVKVHAHTWGSFPVAVWYALEHGFIVYVLSSFINSEVFGISQ